MSLPDLARGDLIDRHPRVRPFVYLDPFQPGLLGRLVNAAGFVFLAAIAQPGNNRHPIAEWLERLQHLRNLEVSPLARRRPGIDVRPLARERTVRKVEEPHARAGLHDRLRQCDTGGDHGIEKR